VVEAAVSMVEAVATPVVEVANTKTGDRVIRVDRITRSSFCPHHYSADGW
jgi:hypothetical protein